MKKKIDFLKNSRPRRTLNIALIMPTAKPYYISIHARASAHITVIYLPTTYLRLYSGY